MTTRRTARAREVADEALPKLEQKSKYRRGAVVERVVHEKTQNAGVVRLDKRTMIFFAEYGEEAAYVSAESEDGRAVRRWLLWHLAKSTEKQKLDWVPVVEIDDNVESYRHSRDDNDENQYTAKMGVKIERYFLALTHDKTEWRVLPWESCSDDSPTQLDDAVRFVSSKRFRNGPKFVTTNRFHTEGRFALPHFDKGSDGATTYLRYTPELWAGLLAIVERVDETRQQLRKLVGSKQGIETVSALGAGRGALLLGSGEEKPRNRKR